MTRGLMKGYKRMFQLKSLSMCKAAEMIVTNANHIILNKRIAGSRVEQTEKWLQALYTTVAVQAFGILAYMDFDIQHVVYTAVTEPAFRIAYMTFDIQQVVYTTVTEPAFRMLAYMAFDILQTTYTLW
ncbi:hypothetical protein BsWGS_16470 [Bradybaena similaris]